MAHNIMLGKNKCSWVIEEVSGLDSTLLVDGKRCRGATHFYNRKIYIDKNLEATDKKQVLLHELAHAILYDTQLELKDEYSEENLCEFIALYGETILQTAEGYLMSQ